MAERNTKRHVDLTLTVEQHARLTHEAGKRGKTLAGYIRERALSDVPFDAAALEARLRDELRLTVRCALHAIAAVVEDALRRATDSQATLVDHVTAARDADALFRRQMERGGRLDDLPQKAASDAGGAR